MCNEPRSSKLKTSSEKILQLFYERGKDNSLELAEEHHSAAMKAIKTIASTTNQLLNMVKKWTCENNICCTCAPFEAEWKCACVERMNVVDAITSTDGDCTILGAKK